MRGADYFLTVCVQRPSVALRAPDLQQLILGELNRLAVDRSLTLRCAVIMPDHVHLVITLGNNAGLSSAMRLFKGRLSPWLRKQRTAWQPSFYDHRLRTGEDLLPIFLYVFLNPYRKNLLTAEQTWRGYYCAPMDWAWFGPMTNERLPEPAWLR